jgi:hypothetical protein
MRLLELPPALLLSSHQLVAVTIPHPAAPPHQSMDSGEGRVEGEERSREGEGTTPPTNAGGAAERGVGVEIVGGERWRRWRRRERGWRQRQ